MKPITIRIAGEDERFAGSFIVEQDGRYADGMGWDEMLGHVIALTLRSENVRNRLSRTSPGLYEMMTPEEHEAAERRAQERRIGREGTA